jgi:hypothetical protein
MRCNAASARVYLSRMVPAEPPSPLTPTQTASQGVLQPGGAGRTADGPACLPTLCQGSLDIRPASASAL